MSASMNSWRSGGYVGSIGTYAAPVLNTASIATSSGDLTLHQDPDETPGLDAGFHEFVRELVGAGLSSAYVSRSVASTTAIASGVLAACSAICTNTGRAVVFVRSVVPARQHLLALVRGQDLEPRDVLLGIRGHRGEQRSGSAPSRRSIVPASNRSDA